MGYSSFFYLSLFVVVAGIARDDAADGFRRQFQDAFRHGEVVFFGRQDQKHALVIDFVAVQELLIRADVGKLPFLAFHGHLIDAGERLTRTCDELLVLTACVELCGHIRGARAVDFSAVEDAGDDFAVHGCLVGAKEGANLSAKLLLRVDVRKEPDESLTAHLDDAAFIRDVVRQAELIPNVRFMWLIPLKSVSSTVLIQLIALL